VKKWLGIAAAVMLAAWAPFLYAELTSSPAEKKLRALPSDEPPAAEAEPIAEAPPDEKVAPAEQAEPPGEPEGQPQPAAPGADMVAAPRPAEPTPGPGDKHDPNAPPEAEDTPVDDEEAHDEEAPPPVASGPTSVLKQAFETQPRDALWAADTEARIAAVFRGDDVPGDMLKSASCRKAVCKVEMRWSRDHAAQYVSVFQSVRDQFGSELAVEPVGELDDSGQQPVHLYLMRKGYTAADLSR